MWADRRSHVSAHACEGEEGLKQLIDIAVKLSGEKPRASAQDDAIFTLSALIGAITMSRLMEDAKLSEHVLKVTKDRLLTQPSKPRR